MELSVVARHSARSSRLAAAVVLAGVGVAALAGSSVAVVSGAQIVSATSVRDTADAKSATATCPPAQRVIGTGVDVGIWAITARAVCANRLPDQRIVAATSPPSSANKSVTATCPQGKRIVGTGARIKGGGGQVGLDDVVPSATSVTAVAREDDDRTARNWALTAYAICAAP